MRRGRVVTVVLLLDPLERFVESFGVRAVASAGPSTFASWRSGTRRGGRVRARVLTGAPEVEDEVVRCRSSLRIRLIAMEVLLDDFVEVGKAGCRTNKVSERRRGKGGRTHSSELPELACSAASSRDLSR